MDTKIAIPSFLDGGYQDDSGSVEPRSELLCKVKFSRNCYSHYLADVVDTILSANAIFVKD